MEQKTKVNAENGKQELVITREFDLPLELLFKAHAEPEFRHHILTIEDPRHGRRERFDLCIGGPIFRPVIEAKKMQARAEIRVLQ